MVKGRMKISLRYWNVISNEMGEKLFSLSNKN